MVVLSRLLPLTAPAVRRVLGPDQPDQEVLQKEEIEAVRPPALLPGMLDRVTGTDELGDLSHHLGAATATYIRHAPVLRRIYRNALVRRDGYATLRTSERYGRALRIKELAGPLVRLSELRYCQSYVSWRFFGHWLTDSIPTSLIDPERGEAWIPSDPAWIHARGYRGSLGIPDLDAPLVLADQLVVYQDFGQGSSKRARYSIIRNKLHSVFGGTNAGDCVYIRRGTTGARRVIRNESELIDQFISRNWKVVDISATSVGELQRVLCGARVVVGMEGSHLAHAQVSLRRNSSLVAIVPHDRFTTLHVGYSNANRVKFGMVVANGSQAGGYHADIEEILRTIDLLEMRDFS